MFKPSRPGANRFLAALAAAFFLGAAPALA
jgi:hypothetical protein